MVEKTDTAGAGNTAPSKMVDLFALIVSGVFSTIVLVSLPIFVALLAQQTGASVVETGWLASMDLLGSAAISTTGLLWVSKWNWQRTVMVALLGSIVLNLLCIPVADLYVMMGLRLLCGCCYGIVLVTTFTGLCHSSNPDRAFGWYVFLQLLFQMVMLFGLPFVTQSLGQGAVFVCFAIIGGIGCVLANFIPKGLPVVEKQVETKQVETKSRMPATGVAGLVALGVYFMAPAALWGYFEPIGQTFRLDMMTIAEVLALTSFAGVSGALAVVVLGTRLGRILSMALGVALSLLAVKLLDGGQGYTMFLLATCLFSFAWNFTFPYQMGVLALYDKAGSMAVPSLVVQLFGLAAGPFAASFLIIDGSFLYILIAVAISYALSFCLFWVSYKKAPTERPIT